MDNSKELIPWDEYYPDLSSASPEQKQFYKYWLRKYQRGEYVDLDGNLSYLFAYIYSLIEEFVETKDIDKLEFEFEKIRDLYGDTTVTNHLDSWLEDAFVYLGDYENALDISRKNFASIDDFLFYSSMMDKSPEITGKDLLNLVGTNYLTRFGNEHIREIEQLADLFLEDFHKEKGVNLVDFFCQDVRRAVDISEEDILEYKDFYIDEDDFYKYKRIDEKQIESGYKEGYVTRQDKSLFRGVVMHGKSSKLNQTESIKLGHTIKNALLDKGRKILRECENTLREEKDIPKIGEGWVNETELYHKLSDEFSEEDVIHHGRPEWLSQQHLDIFFPDYNIGVEYQGRQHEEPVEYFGGKEAFGKQQERDKKKKRKCKRNNCRLIYAQWDYNFEEIKKKVKSAIRQRA